MCTFVNLNDQMNSLQVAGERYVYKFVCEPEALISLAFPDNQRPSLKAEFERYVNEEDTVPLPTWMRECPTQRNKPPKTWAPSPTPKATCTKANPHPSLPFLPASRFPATHHHTHPKTPRTSCTRPPHPLVYKAMAFLFLN